MFTKYDLAKVQENVERIDQERRKRGPYKRGPKSTEPETPVVGVYEEAPAAKPGNLVRMSGNVYNRPELEAVSEWIKLPSPMYAASLLHFFDVAKIVGATDRGAFFGALLEVGKAIKRNDYGVSALEDFIEDPDRLKRAQAHFLRLLSEGLTEKATFSLMLATYSNL